jgi:ABC-type Fe3+-hydroxamate transport system substrate-binding protein
VSGRIVSLVPSSTETLLALGADVVACTRFCEQPGLRHVGGTKNPEIEAIVTLAPDLVVMDREENRIEDHDALVAAGLRVFVSDVRSVDDALNLIGDLSSAVGAPPDVYTLCRAQLVRQRVAHGRRRKAFVPIWRRPWMSIGEGTYAASLLGRLGIDLVTADTNSDVDSEDAYPTVELGALARPELVLVPSEPYAFSEGHLGELRVEFPDSEIVRVDGQDLFWWGVRTPDALVRLSAAL